MRTISDGCWGDWGSLMCLWNCGLWVQGTMERGGMPIGPRGPGGVLPGRGRGMGPPAEWNGRVGSAEQRGGFMQRAPPAGTAAPKTPADRSVPSACPHVSPCW